MHEERGEGLSKAGLGWDVRNGWWPGAQLSRQVPQQQQAGEQGTWHAMYKQVLCE